MRRLIEFLASANIRPVIALRMYQYYGDDAFQLGFGIGGILPYLVCL